MTSWRKEKASLTKALGIKGVLVGLEVAMFQLVARLPPNALPVGEMVVQSFVVSSVLLLNGLAVIGILIRLTRCFRVL